MAAGNTYTPIASQTIASNTNSVTFNSLSGYTDLRIVMTPLVSGNNNMIMKFNGSTTGYEQLYIATYGQTNPPSYFDTNKYTGLAFMYLNAGYSQTGTSIPGIITIDIPYYADTATYTTALTTFGYGQGSGSTPKYWGIDIMQSQWRSNAGVSSIEISFDTGSAYYTAGTVFEVFGIKEA